MNAQDWKIQQNKDIGEYYKLNLGSLKRSILSFKLSPEVVEDIIHIGLISALRSNVEIRDIGGCLRSSVINAARNHIRSRYEKNKISDYDFNFVMCTDYNAEIQMIEQVTIDKLNALVNKITLQQQTAIKLGIMEDLNYNDVAIKMGISRETVKANWRLGILKLRKQIKTWDIPDRTTYLAMERTDAE